MTLSSVITNAKDALLRLGEPASLQVPGEEPVPVVPSNGGTPVWPPHVGVQRLLLGAEGVEQVQGQLPVEAQQRRPLSEIPKIKRRDRLGGLLHEYQQVP